MCIKNKSKYDGTAMERSTLGELDVLSVLAEVSGFLMCDLKYLTRDVGAAPNQTFV